VPRRLEDPQIIRVVTIMEAQFVTGPAKNLLEFAKRARSPAPGLPAIDFSVITYHRDPTREPSDNPFIAAAAIAGIEVDVIHERGPFDRGILPQIAAVVERRAPHVVQTHNVKSHFLMRYSGLWQRQPWIAFHHGYTSTDLKMRLYNQLDRWSLGRAVHAVTVCGPFQRQLQARGVPPERITIRHNAIQPAAPVDQRAVLAVRQSLPCAADTPILLMVSRLSHEKGHVDLLEALAALEHRGVNAHAVIVGEGPERTSIERTVTRRRLTGRVTLVGHRDDVRPYFAVANLYLMPSHSEGSPNALLEAMEARLPIIASSVGGIPEIVTHERDAILVPARRPPMLAEAIERLLRNPAEGMRLAESAWSETSKFTYDAYYRGLVEVYRRVLGAPDRR